MTTPTLADCHIDRDIGQVAHGTGHRLRNEQLAGGDRQRLPKGERSLLTLKHEA